MQQRDQRRTAGVTGERKPRDIRESTETSSEQTVILSMRPVRPSNSALNSTVTAGETAQNFQERRLIR